MGDSTRIDVLEARLAAMEHRLGVLENRTGLNVPRDTPLIIDEFSEGYFSNAASQVGRTLLIFGGAYFLRAITEGNYVPTGLGLSLGAAYALLWLYMAWRAAARDDNRAMAVFYAVSTILLSLPMLIEACTRFALLSGPQGIAMLTLYCGLCLAVAGHRDLRTLAWLAILGGIGTSLVLSRATHTAVPVAAFLLFLGGSSLWMAYLRDWLAPQWPGALGANAGVLMLSGLSHSEQWSIGEGTVGTLGLVLAALYLGSFAINSHRRSHPIGVFEVLQGLMVLGVTAWTVFQAVSSGAFAPLAVGLFGVLAGIGTYALAFTPATRNSRGRDHHYYATLGLALTVLSSALFPPDGMAAVAWALAAVVLAVFSGRTGRVSLSLQCTFLLLAASIGSGLLTTGLRALAGDDLSAWPALDPWQVVVALATVSCLFIPVAQHSERWGVFAGLPQLLVLVLSVCGVGGLLIVALAPPLANVTGTDPSLGVLATLRTGVLAAAAVTLALSARHHRWPEARWLAYPVLVILGLKLATEDFPNGEPSSLFVALALVGGALILVSRLMRRQGAAAGSGA